MKALLNLLIVIILTAHACASERRSGVENASEYYIDSKLSFFDPCELTYADGRYQGYTYETWIRQPENMRMIHETFKKIGYHNLISKYRLTSNPMILWGYVNRPLNQIIDSLVITYPLDTIETTYYREFWQRRENESNADELYAILKELHSILLKDQNVDYNNELVNDTLYNLMLIERQNQNLTNQQAIRNFEYLQSIDMNHSAYNLLYERGAYYDINWNRDSLLQQLPIEKVQCSSYAWIEDNTK